METTPLWKRILKSRELWMALLAALNAAVLDFGLAIPSNTLAKLNELAIVLIGLLVAVPIAARILTAAYYKE
jgi:uncharacterized membrane protein